MKSALLFLALCVFEFSNAQENAIKFNVGYGIPLVNSSVAKSSASQPNFSATFSNVNGSYATGLWVEAGYVRSLSALVSLQFDATYLMGNTINSSDNFPTYVDTYSSYSRFFQFSPQLKVTFGGSKLRPYATVGPAVGFGSLYKKSHFNNDGPIIDSEETFKGSISVGARTSLGLEIERGKFIFSTQLSMVNMNYAPTSSELTKYLSNGVDELKTMTVSQKQTEYKDSYNSGVPGVRTPDQPGIQLKQYYPLSSLSLSAGVMYKF